MWTLVEVGPGHGRGVARADGRRGDNEVEKAWLITRILEYAKWDDIWRYLTVGDVRENLPRLCFRWPRDRELWEYALERWGGHG